MRFFFLLLFLLSRLLPAEPSYFTFPSDIQWKTLESPHFEIIFREGQTDFAKKTLLAAEKAFQLLTPIFPSAPPTTRIVLADFTDSLNGYSLNFPYPHFVIYATPPNSTSELASLDNWLDSVVLHEYVHTLHMYPANGFWKGLRAVFGTWVVPNGMMPQHLHEGLATFLETQLTQGGRGRSPFFKMLTRKAVEKGEFGKEFAPLDLLDGSISRWPHGASPYYFGYFVYEKLWKEKQAEGIRDLTTSFSSNWPYWVNGPFEEVFNVNLPSLWKGIQEEQTLKFQNDLEQIKSKSPSKLTYKTETRYLKRELHVSSSAETAVFLSSSPQKGRTLEVVNLKTGTSSKSFSLPFSGASGLCWNTSNESELIASTAFNEAFYSTHRLNLISNDGKLLSPLKDSEGAIQNVHEFDCEPSEKLLGAYQFFRGKGVLSLFRGELFNQNSILKKDREWQVPQDSWISSISVGEPTYFLLRTENNTQLFEWKSQNVPQAILTIPGHAYQLKRGLKKEFYFISSISGRDEIWNWKIGSPRFEKVLSVTGGVNSFALLPSSLLVSSYEHGGYDIAEAPLTQKELVPIPDSVGSPTQRANSSTTTSEETTYSPLSTLIPRTWVPSALFVPYGLQVGAWIPMFDLSQKHFYDVNLGIDERKTNSGTKILPYLSAQYGYRFGKSSVISINSYYVPTFLTITRSFFERWGASIGVGRLLPGLPVHARVSGVLKKIERSDLGPANRSVGFGLDLGWTSSQSNTVFDRQMLEEIRLIASHQQYLKNLGSQDTYFSTVLSAEGLIRSPIWSDSQWYLSLRQGYTEGTAFYNSFFEGGGELLFSQNRGFFLNRGYLQGSFAARRIFGGNLEYRFPISRVERGVSLWPTFLDRVSGAFVLDTTTFDSGLYGRINYNWMKRFLWSAGFELKTHWKLFFYLPTQIRLGAYRGLSQGGEPFYFTVGVQASL